MKQFIILFALVGLILPAYANVVDPITGLSTCDQIQMEIDSGKKDEFWTREILDNMDKVKDGKIEIIDSDCIFLIDIAEYFGDDDGLIIGNLVNRTSRYDGIYEATIYFQDYTEPNRIPGGVMTAIFEIRDGTIRGDNLDLRGLVAYDGGVSMELQFAGGECYPWGEMEPTNKLSAESSCTYGDMRIEAQKIGELGPKEQGGGCLIATAAFGSELAPQVQFLREIRDNTVLETELGTTFMTGFNHFYYSFSPVVADYERENPVFKEAVKLTLTPLLTSLTLLQYTDIDSESEMLGYGISLILLNVGMYFVAPAMIIYAIRKTPYTKFFKSI